MILCLSKHTVLVFQIALAFRRKTVFCTPDQFLLFFKNDR
ncbi:Uncharacterized protein dnm_099540 [Desulfonema magnum]|uniref:Uncharacterized protein n=1 Tax=Desulfonema magnum TaxID=45655 RepID=A0A975BXW2_9BACT|nr:Uncharacterized protein dnm_099540 [Desulfonema magnum]